MSPSVPLSGPRAVGVRGCVARVPRALEERAPICVPEAPSPVRRVTPMAAPSPAAPAWVS